jgi:hypothetical protein
MEWIKKMNKSIIIVLFSAWLVSCASNKNVQKINKLPACLESAIKVMSSDPSRGTPQSVSRYIYNAQIVYYVLSACCDKYNIVYDSACNILGYPDGGFSGKGDGKMLDFKTKATGGEVVWRQ